MTSYECEICPAGNSCEMREVNGTNTTEPVACASGLHSLEGLASCYNCPEGTPPIQQHRKYTNIILVNTPI